MRALLPKRRDAAAVDQAGRRRSSSFLAVGARVLAVAMFAGAAGIGGVVATAPAASAANRNDIPTNANICWSQTQDDALGDANSLDIASATVEYDCVSHLITVGVTTVDAFATPQVNDFFAAFDTDGNPSTGCGGADLYAEAAWSPARNEMLAALYTVTSCSSPSTIAQWLTPKRNTTHDLYLTFDPSSYFPHLDNFAWNVFLAPDPDNFDVIGNGMFSASIPNFPPTGSTAFSPQTVDQIDGTFTDVLPGDFNGDGKTDLLLYRAGPGADAIWTSQGGGHFASTPVSINGAYSQIIPGDFDHDGKTDLIFYNRGTAPDYLWTNIGTGHPVSHPLTINGSYIVIPGDFNGDGYTDLLFYAPGPAQDYLWTFHNGGYTSTPVTINGYYEITPADLNGDHRTDLLFYAPGTAPDYIWIAQAGGGFSSFGYPINNSYTEIVPGDFNGDGHDDLFLWGRGWAPDALLRGTGTAPYLAAGSQTVINEPYDMIVPGDFNGDGKTDLFLIQFGSGTDVLWNGV